MRITAAVWSGIFGLLFLGIGVADAAAPAGRYLCDGSPCAAATPTDTVVDTKTGLMWQRAVNSTTRDWVSTFAYCEDLTLAGHSDWRVPSVKEMASIIDYSVPAGAANDFQAFASTGSFPYWTSTPSAGTPSAAYYVAFNAGGVGATTTANTYRVQCVR